MRILIAEDNEETLQAYKDALEAREHTVTLSFDGQDCLTKYTGESGRAASNDSTSFDVVILDYKMPRMDGLEAAKKALRRRHRRGTARLLGRDGSKSDRGWRVLLGFC